jgi:hypothetical protein
MKIFINCMKLLPKKWGALRKVPPILRHSVTVSQYGAITEPGFVPARRGSRWDHHPVES